MTKFKYVNNQTNPIYSTFILRYESERNNWSLHRNHMILNEREKVNVNMENESSYFFLLLGLLMHEK
jgi:hypothetical protein